MVIVLFLCFPAQLIGLGGAETMEGGTVGTAPATDGVEVPTATINGSSDSTIEIGYNASGYVENGTVSVEDLGLSVDWPTNGSTTNLTARDGTTNVTVPAGHVRGGDHVLQANLINLTSGELIDPPTTYDSADLFAETKVSVDGYSLSNTSIDTGDSVTVNATLNNTASSAENVTVAVYTGWNESKAVSHYAVNGSTTTNVSLTTDPFDVPGDVQVRVNGEPSTTLTVNETTANVSVTNSTLATDTVASTGDFTVNVTLENTGDADGETNVSVWGWGEVNSTEISNSTTLSVPANSTVTKQFTVGAAGADKYDIYLPDGTSETGWALADGTHIVLTNVPDPIKAVANESTFIGATGYNLGNTDGSENLTVERNGSVLDKRNVSVDSTNKTSVNFQATFTEKGNGTVLVGKQEYNLTVRERVVVDSAVTCLSGPCPDETVTADLALNANMLQGSLRPENSTHLEDTNATTDTRFRLDVTVRNFSAPVLIATGNNVTWDRTRLNETHTRYVVDITASEYDHLKDAHLGSWPTGDADTADFHRNATVDLAFDPMTYYDDQPERKEAMNGTVIATDAQAFGRPQFSPGSDSTDPSLSLRVAGPHYTPTGDVNDGYYEAFLPNGLLDTWGVSDPSTLEAAYQNNDTAITAESVSGGIYVDIPIHYSSGTVKLKPDTDTDDSDDDNGFGWGGDDGSDSENEISEGTDDESGNESDIDEDENTTVDDRDDEQPDTDRDGESNVDESESDETPGFGSVATLFSLLAVVLIVTRRQ